MRGGTRHLEPTSGTARTSVSSRKAGGGGGGCLFPQNTAGRVPSLFINQSIDSSILKGELNPINSFVLFLTTNRYRYEYNGFIYVY